MSLKSVREIIEEVAGETFEQRVATLMEKEAAEVSLRNSLALRECRTTLTGQIERLERIMGIEAAFPVTLQLLRVCQELTQRIEKERAR